MKKNSELALINKVMAQLNKYQPTFHTKDDLIFIEIENDSNNQSLIIQAADLTSLWVRLKEPFSSYYCESLDEFIKYSNQLLNDEIEIAIGFQGSEWKETEIVYTGHYSELNPNFQYKIASWNKKSS